MSKFITIKLLILLFLSQFILSCNHQKEPKEKILRIASTTCIKESGLENFLFPFFEHNYNTKIELISIGTGKALEMGARGKVDLVFVHYKKQEMEFIKKGYGINRSEIMYNNFALLGPTSHQHKLKNITNIRTAFKEIANQKLLFISRGDESGTHSLEKLIWNKIKIHPKGDWYFESGKSMLKSLNLASKKQAYILSDLATYQVNKKNLNLRLIHEGDDILQNIYSLIAINPVKFPNVNFEQAMNFINFLLSYDGKELINGYGQIRYGKSLYRPTKKLTK